MVRVPAAVPSEESWQPARLIPVVGIRGQDEQEKRATSSLLAVMGAVPDFGHALLNGLGASRGRISTFTEVQLKDGDGKVSIPDGVVVVERGKTRWRALVEVKTSGAALHTEQVGRYLEMARDHGFDAVLTISNQITARPQDSPVAIDRRKTRRIDLYHLSWWRIMTEAVLQHRFRGINDPDQAWLLGELIAYLDHERSGASGFQDMGQSWVRVRDGARQGTLRASDKEVRAVAERWEQFVDYLALGLSQDLGRDVEPVRPRKQTLLERIDLLVRELEATGSLSGGVRVPDTVAAVSILADLRARQLVTSVSIDAPREGRPASRISWMTRQLANAPADVRLTVSFAGTRETTSALLSEAREYPQRLLNPSDAKREPRSFELAMNRPLGVKSGKGQGSFIGETRGQVIEFYRELVQNLKRWQAPPPKLPETQVLDIPKTPQSDAPPFASDGRDLGEATTPTEPALATTPDQPDYDT
jgi:hypothetical protein